MAQRSDLHTVEDSFVDAARSIGLRLCDEAMWDDRRGACSWRGADFESPGDPASKSIMRALGGHLYGGSAGIAFFLSQLGRATSEPIFASTARAALRHAVEWARNDAELSPVPVFSSKLGIAYVILTSAIPDADLQSAAAGFLADARDAFRDNRQGQALDIINGTAGAILVLLALRRASADHLEFAAELGADLCARAEWSEDYCTWDSKEVLGFDYLPLAGMSHGASGLAVALLKLFQATRDRELLVTARGAFAHEDTLFEPERGNWLDLRFVESVEQAKAKSDNPVAWCHGAAGIALSRMVALEIDTAQADRHRQSLALAADATLRALDDAMAHPGWDASLCHGIAGLVESLSTISEPLREPRLRTAAFDAARELVARHATSKEWPLSFPERAYNPSLMVGIAGIGLTLLRLANSEDVPSIALISS
jgi:lantibiotic modifying enzyme